MKTLSSGLLAHMGQELSTLATLVKITRADGTVLGFTSHDSDIVYAGLTYKADTAFTASALESRVGLSADNMDVFGMLDSSGISESALKEGRFDDARVDVYQCNWADISQGVMQLRRGWLGEIKISNGVYRAELRGLTDLLQRPVGHVYTPECRNELGDSACGISLAAHTVTGMAGTAASRTVFTDTARTEAAGMFDYGLLTWTGGANAGLKMDIKSFVSGGTFTLWLPMPNAIAAGDTYSAIKGCDKRLSSCKTKFANVTNFGGFPHLPGLDKILDYPEVR